MKGSQTIFPLGADHCLILSNLEYAKKPDVNPLENRTFARNYRPTMVSTIDFIRSRELDDQQVSEINFEPYRTFSNSTERTGPRFGVS